MKQSRPKYDLEFFYTSFPQRDLVRWYQWEFLRRNREYKQDYAKFKHHHEKWLNRKGYWYDLGKRPKWSRADERFFYARIAPEIVRLCSKWHIGDLHPPQWRFPKHRSRPFSLKRSSGPPTGSAPELNWDPNLIKELLEMGFTGDGGNARRFGHLFLVEFDLKWPMKDQLDFAKRVLRRAQRKYRDATEKHEGRLRSRRRRFAEYDTHLRVWDLNSKGKNATQIARELFPTCHGDSVLQRVHDHLSAARGLVQGRYSEIR
jgi:hypothetical protein